MHSWYMGLAAKPRALSGLPPSLAVFTNPELSELLQFRFGGGSLLGKK